MTNRHSPLTELFLVTGRSLLALPSGGVTPRRFGDETAEHLATRHSCGLFDFSFMGAWEIAGPQAATHLARLQTRDLRSMQPNQIVYTLMCREDGTIFNDTTVWMLSPERFWLFSGRKSDSPWVNSESEDTGVRIRQMDGDLAVLALQGPNSGRLLSSLIGEEPVRCLGYFRFTDCNALSENCRLARIGYSGELGYEIIVPAGQGARVWQWLREAGRPFGLLECGFGAANSLRIESGYILCSNELVLPRLPAEVGLERLVTSVSPTMRGRNELIARGTATHANLICAEILKEEYATGNAPGLELELTSEAFSPLFGKKLGLGFAAPTSNVKSMALRTQHGMRAVVSGFPCYDPARQRPRARPIA